MPVRERPERVDGADEPMLVPEGVSLGYARVSTAEQSLEMQRQKLLAAGCYEVYADVGKSGATMARPELEACLRALQPGNTLVVWKLDRLGRTVRGLAQLLHELDEKGVRFRSLTEGVDTTTMQGRLMFNIIASVAEMERDLIAERTRAGLAVAAGKGGRPPRLQEHDVVEVRRLRHEQGWTLEAIAEKFKVSRSTVIRAIRQDGLGAAGYRESEISDRTQETPQWPEHADESKSKGS
ncbi:recombinase family protein [Kocuria rosea]|uniref:recombinase family protein n=1 Tax=Kocuria rosea TaxID=1275 RepID=UPI0025B76F29|nr:recombinase family protein [Kocuria rosea]WJZ68605.1 recombinase family protein [Kocuria rosea]